MVKIGKLFMLFLLNSKLTIAKSMEYRFNFFLGSLIALVFSGMGPLLQYLLFTQTKGFPGWNLDQIILFQGVLLVVLGLRNLAFGELHEYVAQLIWRGEFDRLLLKPFPPIGIILASGFSFNSIGSILAGVIILIYSIIKLKLQIGILYLGLFLAFLAVGLVLFMALEILYSCLVVLFVRLGRLYDIMNFFARFGEYPLEIFNNSVRLVFVTVVPFAVWVNIPANLLLGRMNIYMAYSFVFSFLFFFGCLKLWGMCMKKYSSAGG